MVGDEEDLGSAFLPEGVDAAAEAREAHAAELHFGGLLGAEDPGSGLAAGEGSGR